MTQVQGDFQSLKQNTGPGTRGYTAYNQPVSWVIRLLIIVTDTIWISALIFFGFKLLNIHFFLTPVTSIFGIVTILILRTGQQSVFSATLGQMIWKTQILNKTTLQKAWGREILHAGFLRQRERLTPVNLSTAIFLTLVIASGSLAIFRETIWQSPALVAANVKRQPALALQGDTWEIRPYFYSLGAWPNSFAGHPIFYSLPYEKGPPAQFVGHVIATWEDPEIKMTAEGPKTPKVNAPAKELRECLTHSAWQNFWNTRCCQLRQQSLERHLKEMHAFTPTHYEIEWFDNINPALGPDEETQGFHLRAENDYKVQDRFVLVSAQGTQQTFILDRPNNELGQNAYEIFEQSIRSQRYSNELNPGRAWVDQRLTSIHLNQIQAIADPEMEAKEIAEIQGLLLSKLSVEPSSYEGFYHLGGTAFLLYELGKKQNRSYWKLIAQPLVHTAVRYAEDVAPEEKRNIELRKLRSEL